MTTTTAENPSRKPPALSPTATGSLATGARDSLRLAAIDVGSNSIHMVVAQADADGAMTTLWRMKEPVGLGRMSFPSHRLSKIATDTAVATLARFKQAAQQRQAEKIITIATSAVREAHNGGDFIERVKRELGMYVRVVSAREEARLIYLAVRHAIPLRDRPHLILDIGGGSVEFIVGDERRAAMLESRKLGAARMTARFITDDPASEANVAGLRRHYERELAPLCAAILTHSPERVIGTSGTLENIAAMCAGFAPAEEDENEAPDVYPDKRAGAEVGSGRAADDTGAANRRARVQIERSAFEALLAELLRSSTAERARIRGLDDQRKDQIVAGALLVDELFRRLNLRRIQLCPAALREGILLDYLSRHIPDLQVRREVPDPRRRSVLDLARRCDWHRTHSEQVTMLCLRLFDELKSLHQLGPAERELIEYASLLHDIGWHIGRKDHHKHSMYLIANGDLKGFADDEVQVIANVARYHRKSPPRRRKHRAYADLPSRARRTVDVGAALLRLADGLDRSHAGVVTALRCRSGPGGIRCVLSVRADAELEIWGARRKMKWFERVFDKTIDFRLEKR